MSLVSSTRILQCGDGIAVAEIGPVCVVIWRDAVVRSRFEKQKQGLAAVVEKNPGSAAFVFVVEPTAAPPDEQLRKASMQMIADHQERLRCVAGVIEGTGFKAAVARSVLSGITLLLGKREVPISYFAKVGEATRWVSQQVVVDPLQLATAIEAVRSRLDPLERKFA